MYAQPASARQGAAGTRGLMLRGLMRAYVTLSLVAATCALRTSPCLRAVHMRPTLALRMDADDAAAADGSAVEAAEDMAVQLSAEDTTAEPQLLTAAAEVRAAEEMAEMRAAREVVKRSISRPAAERKKLLRELQVKWHPDRQYGDEASRAFAAELSIMVNEAADVARKQIGAAEARRRREDAYDELQRVLSEQGVDELRAAIQEARGAGVSDIEVTAAETALARREQAGALGPALKALQAAIGAFALACAAAVVIGSGQSAEKLAAERAAAAKVAVERAQAEALAAQSAENLALERVAAARLAAELAAKEQAAAEAAERQVAKRLEAAQAETEQAVAEQAAAESAVKALAERKAAGGN